MKRAQIATLQPGIYRLRFDDGRTDVAVVGVDPRGERWFAPSSYHHPCTTARSWRRVSSVEWMDPRKSVAKEQPKEQRTEGFTCGALFNPRAWWIGGHYSRFNRRLCLNVLPFCTVWLALPGGITPR